MVTASLATPISSDWSHEELRARAARRDAARAQILTFLGRIEQTGGERIFREVTDPVAPDVLTQLVREGAVVVQDWQGTSLYSLPSASSIRAKRAASAAPPPASPKVFEGR